ncbi:MAG: hypothetical protein IKJ18_08130 [Bacteroidaceae bacterium]|nr:hypothetical protein [Bacteroidaceae bacterium]
MKPTTNFSRIAVIGYSLYFLIETVIYPLITKVPPLLSTILNAIYIASFIGVAAWIISHDSTLKKPATFIIIATLFGLVNRILTFYMYRHPEMDAVKFSLIIGAFYFSHLIFSCMGFFKLAKGLPKGLARYMAQLVPWTALASLIISNVFTILMTFMTIPHAVLRSPNIITFLAEILAMMLLCYSLPKAIEIKRTINTEH